MATSKQSTNFKIWAVDNVVYGPVDLPTLVGWVKEERVTEDTWIHAAPNDRWQKAVKLPELETLFRARGSDDAPVAHAVSASPLAAGKLKPGMLRRVKIFAGMSDAQLEEFIGYFEEVTAPQLSEIVKQGSPGDAMFLVLQGEVRVRVKVRGKESIIATLATGDFFGEMSLFDHGPRSADVVANVDTLLLRISVEAFHRITNEAPEIAAPFLFAISKTLATRIRTGNKRFFDLVDFTRTLRSN